MKESRFPVTSEGYPFIVPGILLTIFFHITGLAVLAALSFILTGFVAAFFRDPRREIRFSDGEVLSPADGRVLSVSEVKDPPYLEGEWQKVSIFMSVFNCHINRVPISGRVEKIRYRPGRFLLGFSEKASLENEHNAVTIDGGSGRKVMFVQIAGLVARRIVCHLNEGDEVRAGDRFGMIRFGSRCDVYMPKEANISVVRGDRVKGGLSVIGKL